MRISSWKTNTFVSLLLVAISCQWLVQEVHRGFDFEKFEGLLPVAEDWHACLRLVFVLDYKTGHFNVSGLF